MDAESIKKDVTRILINKMGVSKETLEIMPNDMSILDGEVGLKPRDLITLFFDLQEKYGILFDEQDIIGRRFDRIDNIVESIMEKCMGMEQ